mmetsp:Transcript_33616/g.24278  ORF Transcript_33616/g.24278 Transcript_33616/m.24278 type:complete len:180 (-) Transcript_33616:163-702(-)|eukprot:CAMPEP_0116878504 /NCGR_PEP_ID=MMETSP0463-20121206/10257_1 /TAXON_ID=181622 /ORGANISM="Strombidinopsis sp, Strain SopsisLIS2011" /LENGTH=179 /DNA_ID=CAMNT_0004526797 /DNA_START=233 /DNA_END=772 /DNA_ORIENTATION=+
MESEKDKKLLENLAKHVGQVNTDLNNAKPKFMDAFFFPNKANVDRLVRYIKYAKKQILICVFNLTNDDLAAAILERHKAGVEIRVISDDECMENKGSDIHRLANSGIYVRTDDAPEVHMHNKFMVVDNEFVLTGSFNWTYQAGSKNQENLLVVDNKYYVTKYVDEFEKLWKSFKKNEVE